MTHYKTVLELYESVCARVARLIRNIAARDGKLGDQLRRSWSSVGMNLAEADGYQGKSRCHSIRIAIGSNRETQTGLGIGVAFEYLGQSELDEVVPDIERITAMATARLNANR
ncbi:four helix bundle protein [bacterium AH-315-N03]|nr:four helix bundle protein [bacterium AH-315-N03]